MKAVKVAPIVINKDTDGTFGMDYSENESMRSSRSKSPKQPPAQSKLDADLGFVRVLKAFGMLLGWKPAAKKGKKLQAKKSGKSSIRWTPRRDDR
jgi:hypothetical protein